MIKKIIDGVQIYQSKIVYSIIFQAAKGVMEL
jgi:hypothetical protein